VGWTTTKAIEADPNYSVAYARRVCAASWLADFDVEKGPGDAVRALELGPHDAETNRIMGAVELMSGNFDEALACNRRAMQLNPTDAYIKARCASVYTFTGDPEAALALLDEAERLDPFLPVWCVEERGVALYALDRYAAAIEALSTLPFQSTRSRLYRAASMIAFGRHQEANRIVREALGDKPGLTASGFARSERYRDSDAARRLGRLLEEAGLPP
jgi:adenylate cyclase